MINLLFNFILSKKIYIYEFLTSKPVNYLIRYYFFKSIFLLQCINYDIFRKNILISLFRRKAHPSHNGNI